MRKCFLVALVLAGVLVLATSGSALEKTSARFTDDGRADGWNAGTTCSVVYYNFCTGWVWIWSGWTPGDRLGVCFDNCCPVDGVLNSNFLFAWTGAPSGYGFTGTIAVSAADNSCCPWPPGLLASQTYLPLSGWNMYVWGVAVPNTFVIAVTHGLGALPNPTSYASDHPGAGPTGPVACGTCYPTTRVNHTFFYGTAASPLCPGSTLFDGVCDAQLLWDAQLSCAIGVEETTWAQIKSLYR